MTPVLSYFALRSSRIYHDIMKRDHESRKNRVSEPVQVYLGVSDRDRLERLRAQLDATKSDVLRLGLAALERELTTPEGHPAMAIVGIAGDSPRPRLAYDAGADHDRFLAESEESAWKAPTEGKRGR